MDLPIAVVVVGLDRLARVGLVGLLADEPLVEVAGDASDAGGVDALDPDVVVWDLGRGPVVDDLRIRPTVALVEDPALASAAVAAGAVAVLRRDGDGGRLAAAILAAHEGLLALDRPLAGQLLRDPPPPPDTGPQPTRREVEVLDLLAQGFSNAQIASRLGISPHTAKFHVRSILDKVGATTRTEAVVLAARLGWLVL